MASNDSPTKQRILKVGARLFAKNGYDATGVKELGDVLGFGRGALYHHIESKENLLYEISIRHVLNMVACGQEILASGRPPEEKFRELARQLMSTIAEDLPEVTVFFHEHRSLSKAHSAELTEVRDRFEAVWVSILDEGVEAGVFRPFPPVIVKGILGMFNYSYIWIAPRGDMSPAEVADIFSTMALRGLRT